MPDAQVSITSPFSAEVINGTDVVVTYSVSGTDYDHLHLSMDGEGHNTIRDLTGTFTFTNVEAGEHTLTAQLVNSSHQPLVTDDAVDTVTFTVENTGVVYPPVAVADGASVITGESVAIAVLANDTDADDGLDVSSVTIVDAPLNGSVSVDASGVVTYVHSGVNLDADSFTYQVSDLGGLVSEVTTVTITVASETGGYPLAGLVLHLDGDQGVLTDASGVTQWQDQSGMGNHLDETSGDPQLVSNAVNGHAAVDFDGAQDWLRRSSVLTGMPSGSADRTVVMVVNYRGAGFGGFSWGNAACNETFGLAVTKQGRLVVQGYCSDFKTDELGMGAGWQIQAATVSGDALTHYLNGAVIDTATHTYATSLEQLVVGAEIDTKPAVDMQVAEILVYDRALTTEELSDVNAYLQSLYFN